MRICAFAGLFLLTEHTHYDDIIPKLLASEVSQGTARLIATLVSRRPQVKDFMKD